MQKLRKYTILFVCAVFILNASGILSISHRVDCTVDGTIFLKFHKVGSGSVRHVLTNLSNMQSDEVTWWNRDKSLCGEGPHEHEILKLFRLYGAEWIRNECTFLGKQSALHTIAILRNPTEKVISQLYFFHDILMRRFRLSHSIMDHQYAKDLKNAHAASLLLKTDPKAISALQMSSLLHVLSHHPSFLYPIDSFFGIHEYEHVLSRSRDDIVLSGNSTSCNLAVETLSGISAVGCMEHMPSFFVLLSKRFNIPLRFMCGEQAQQRYMASDIYSKAFKTKTRPVASSLFSDEVLDVIEQELLCERRIWTAAEKEHELQMQRVGYSVQNATDEFFEVCASASAGGYEGRARRSEQVSKV